MSCKRVFTASARKEPEEQSGSTRQGKKRVSMGGQPRAKTSSRDQKRKPLRPEEEYEGKTTPANC